MIQRLIAILMWLENRLTKWKSNSTIRFGYVHGGYYVSSPVEPTRKVGADWFRKMVAKARSETNGVVKFVRCPGMYDYFQEGYVVVAHADIHIKANSVGVIVTMPQVGDPALQPAPMDYTLVDGMAPIQPGVAKMVFKIPMPFGIYMEHGHSAHLMPAFMHSPFMDKLFVYPGTVDYDGFHICNFIFSPIKECEFTIPAGTPLIHVLPFKRINYHGISGPAKLLEADKLRFGFPSRVAGAYRRMFHQKKIYTSEVKK